MGEAVFERDGSLVTVVLDGHPQSAVDIDDPEHLDFEYAVRDATFWLSR